MLDASGVDPAGQLDAKIVARKTESGPQAKAGQVQPTRFVGWTLLAAIGCHQKHVGQLADGGQGPGVLPKSQDLFQFGRQLFGRDGRLRPRREDRGDQRQGVLQRLFGDDRGRFLPGGIVGLLSGRLAQFELQAPAILADLGFAPGFECPDFR